jgi:hypothetical protein
MKKIFILIFLFLSVSIFSQKEKSTNLGLTSLDELKMTIYDKDSSAIAVVLHEHANLYLDRDFDHDTRIDYYYRIKILDKAAFNLANVTINLYKKKKAINFRGITYNLSEGGFMQKTSLQKENVFTTKESENWSSKKFTMPNIKEGSVIEYSYSIISPYLGIPDWYFQSDIPKIKSEFDAAVLGNYQYNVRIIGFLKLDKDTPSVKKKCVFIEGAGHGDCLLYSYGMYNVPAFEEEDYMLSKKNYISRLSFDLKMFTSTRGVKEKYTTTWKEADHKLKKLFLNNQTSKKNYFKRRISDSILLSKNNLERAKKVYTFIQNHYTWDEQYWNIDEQVKDAFNNKVGSASEINLSLYNSLRAADIKTSLVILSTRNNGIPTTLFPVINDFNYVIVKAIIDGKTYFLDATNKYFPFGEIPVRCLNDRAREINFNEESNWVVLNPKVKTTRMTNAKLVLSENGELSGDLMIRRTGYYAFNHREKINTLSEEKYLENFESKSTDLEVDEYKVIGKDLLDKPTQEVFKITYPSDENMTDKYRINPFLFERIKNNPFKLKQRNYPVDFAYPKRNSFSLRLQIPENYTVTQLPKDVAFSLPNKGGNFVLKTVQKDNMINLYIRMNINKKTYSSEEYYALKEFFNQIVIAENSYITLKKK